MEMPENYYVIRTKKAVHVGYMVRREGREVELKKSRRIWYWQGACSLSQIAVDGVKNPEKCKFSVPVPSIILTDAIEIISCTQKAKQSIEGVPEWKV